MLQLRSSSCNTVQNVQQRGLQRMEIIWIIKGLAAKTMTFSLPVTLPGDDRRGKGNGHSALFFGPFV